MEITLHIFRSNDECKPGSFGLEYSTSGLAVPGTLMDYLEANEVTSADEVTAFLIKRRDSMCRELGWTDSEYEAALAHAANTLPQALQRPPPPYREAYGLLLR